MAAPITALHTGGVGPAAHFVAGDDGTAVSVTRAALAAAPPSLLQSLLEEADAAECGGSAVAPVRVFGVHGAALRAVAELVERGTPPDRALAFVRGGAGEWNRVAAAVDYVLAGADPWSWGTRRGAIVFAGVSPGAARRLAAAAAPARLRPGAVRDSYVVEPCAGGAARPCGSRCAPGGCCGATATLTSAPPTPSVTSAPTDPLPAGSCVRWSDVDGGFTASVRVVRVAPASSAGGRAAPAEPPVLPLTDADPDAGVAARAGRGHALRLEALLHRPGVPRLCDPRAPAFVTSHADRMLGVFPTAAEAEAALAAAVRRSRGGDGGAVRSGDGGSSGGDVPFDGDSIRAEIHAARGDVADGRCGTDSGVLRAGKCDCESCGALDAPQSSSRRDGCECECAAGGSGGGGACAAPLMAALRLCAAAWGWFAPASHASPRIAPSSSAGAPAGGAPLDTAVGDGHGPAGGACGASAVRPSDGPASPVGTAELRVAALWPARRGPPPPPPPPLLPAWAAAASTAATQQRDADSPPALAAADPATLRPFHVPTALRAVCGGAPPPRAIACVGRKVLLLRARSVATERDGPDAVAGRATSLSAATAVTHFAAALPSTTRGDGGTMAVAVFVSWRSPPHAAAEAMASWAVPPLRARWRCTGSGGNGGDGDRVGAWTVPAWSDGRAQRATVVFVAAAGATCAEIKWCGGERRASATVICAAYADALVDVAATWERHALLSEVGALPVELGAWP